MLLKTHENLRIFTYCVNFYENVFFLKLFQREVGCVTSELNEIVLLFKYFVVFCDTISSDGSKQVLQLC